MSNRALATFAFSTFAVAAAFGADVWVEAEDFAVKGDWKVDTQFTHRMGSAYLRFMSTHRQLSRWLSDRKIS